MHRQGEGAVCLCRTSCREVTGRGRSRYRASSGLHLRLSPGAIRRSACSCSVASWKMQSSSLYKGEAAMRLTADQVACLPSYAWTSQVYLKVDMARGGYGMARLHLPFLL